MTHFVPMRPEYFASFAEREIAAYAHENVAAFCWEDATAGERARAQFLKLLPQGLATPGQYLYEILDESSDDTIGDLWFEVSGTAEDRSAYLYDLRIHRPFRGQPHARAALRMLEARCRELGACSLGLHVFAHNTTTQTLYVSLGFAVTGFNMAKRLDGV
ncbi:MAG TPA: GNAT family N-acetyltransferase [Rhodanobacteraceae bacterium]|nr:GNAT family N-acetyltransferase [Rhodanobacteraceae bacterium]